MSYFICMDDENGNGPGEWHYNYYNTILRAEKVWSKGIFKDVYVQIDCGQCGLYRTIWRNGNKLN